VGASYHIDPHPDQPRPRYNPSFDFFSACNATELLFNLRASVRLERFVSEFKAICQKEDTDDRDKLGPMLYDSYDIADNDE
jgi:hypothetical protein